MKKLFAVLLVLAVVFTCFAACGGNKATDGNAQDSVSDEQTTSAPVYNPPFPDFTSKTIDGKDVDQNVFKGNKLTVVNIWGTFCGPCINEMPDLEKLSRDYADKGVSVIGIVADVYDYIKSENNADKIKKAEDIIADAGVTYMNILPSASLNEARLNYISTFPTTYFINEKGEIIGEYIGSRTYRDWSTIIDRMISD